MDNVEKKEVTIPDSAHVSCPMHGAVVPIEGGCLRERTGKRKCKHFVALGCEPGFDTPETLKEYGFEALYSVMCSFPRQLKMSKVMTVKEVDDGTDSVG